MVDLDGITCRVCIKMMLMLTGIHGQYTSGGGRFQSSAYGGSDIFRADSLNFESAMNSLLARSRYGSSMPLYQPGAYGSGGDSYRRTWSLDPARDGAAGGGRGRMPVKRPAGRPVVEEKKSGPTTRGNARVGATNTRSSGGKPEERKVTRIATPTLESLMKLDSNKDAFVGLKYITEMITEIDGQRTTYTYKCSLCSKNNCSPTEMFQHIISKDHRRNYIKDNALEDVDDKDLPKRAAAIEKVHGRGKWKVVHETKGLKRFDKSAFVTKKKKTGKAGGDIEVVDVKDPDLQDGDIVVDELTAAQVNEDIPNPKFVVLQYFDQLLAKDFSIETDTEAMVVDSIIHKLDAALFTYSKKAPKVVDEVAEASEEGEDNKNGATSTTETEVKGHVAPMEA